MKIIVFGITHKKATIDLREKVAFSQSKKQEAYSLLKESPFIHEAVILSTCNRSEVFAVVQDTSIARRWFKRFYTDFFQLKETALEGCNHFEKGREAVQYLYHVCVGVDSLVIGEDQILGQVKEAHAEALDFAATGKILNKLFLEAVTTAKEVKTETAISENALSISSIAVKQMENHLKGLVGKTVLVVGFGKMSRIAIENLLCKGIKRLYICNRTKESVQELIEKHPQIHYLSYDQKYEMLNGVDAVISATGAPHFIFYKEDMEKIYQKHRPMCMIDIALPRDIDPAVKEIEGIELFHIDDLKEIANENLAYRMDCIEIIKQSINEAIEKYEGWYQCLPIYPRIQAIKAYSETLTDQELEKLFKRLDHMAEEDRQVIEVVVKSLVKKMWKTPILQLKDAGIRGNGEAFAAFVDEFLGLDAGCGK
ncbi:Glutamyl-tRNA reductase [Alkaliphilus metalliredigens QYMF]|uniref:Glutamyl-tRNA reductase n=1 Tax=Alkaliphilus metalliredigens (strain QYMF) TaxID=293826 RepID=HEM1_ALKMQ|nr:glutamyl-tRNA reductase [Alkaliphilus metalliredigens]A6TJD3.1 RecName: Full=Glutamyl-tRNA reductase; Short=GluTR [Alkaliphilus metalliredigens QYMF]ABR46301.1 Glutamyl-tRNA reductase [Alkaliphilus metalliredigens QYMF]